MMKFKLFLISIALHFISLHLFAQNFVGINFSNVSMMYKAQNFHSIIENPLKGKGFDLFYLKKINRFGVEAKLFYSSLTSFPQYEVDGPVSTHSYIQNYKVSPLNTFGCSASFIYFLLPKTLYVKFGTNAISSAFIEHEFSTIFINTYSPYDTSYNNLKYTSQRGLGFGLTLGTGVLIKVYKRVYFNSSIDYFFTGLNTEITETGSYSSKMISNPNIFNKMNSSLDLVYLNLNIGLSIVLVK